MRWQGRRQSDNVEDVRGQQSGGLGGGFGRGGGMGGGPGFRIVRGGGISGILILVVMFFVLRAFGIDPLPFLFGDGSINSTQTQQSSGRTAAEGGKVVNDEATQFARTVLAETEDVWSGIFQSRGQTYTPPTMVLFSDGVRSACGMASSASGPFYCPGDRKLYLDLTFFNELANRFGASGDFANAYVISHEVGHHVQNLLGILPRFNQMRQQMNEAQANQMSVRVELQADCFAGVWGYYTDRKGILEAGDLEEAINAAHQIGDDTLQKRSQGYVVPESFNHGTSAQRAKWFQRGFESGKIESCDTFSGDI
ncbi:flagellar biosynthesis protein FlgM [Ochrobactrum sp. MYb15]|uniref:KPN_02809 family neutral zinc metallopeptidase n=1 Tax=Brucella TaxID=234 RepID=UPI0004651200|nr:neutral zinc metallopeptidase [Brucella rhizosphaerae]PQZ51479.1 flagellar biosynthesis protein FlgM [Ochrobactrum sp. MYb19]PRA65488.1 flagellar biosynthesis protein FlgM [Ochrobactrum sp. MYb18]PRA77178.1 flagellar biosynthesis protein FlgM [Brucella thiophenivorans]PRA93188.1 flagellar biosynthesis protein FlgM [Ochrobactrum sp. MYb14]PRA99187.1 flagellar biosynthesis protein FlgM [Ochrobactrum sp. MYb15]